MRELLAVKEEKETAAWMRFGNRIPQRKSLTSTIRSTASPGAVSAGENPWRARSGFWLRMCVF